MWKATLIVGNIVIVGQLIRRKKNPRCVQSHGSSSPVSQMTVLLVAVSSVYIILILPSCVFKILILKASQTNIDFEEFDLLHTLEEFGHLLMFVNNSCNFYIYCLTGTKFREALKSAFYKSPMQPIPMSPSTSSARSKSLCTTISTDEAALQEDLKI